MASLQIRADQLPVAPLAVPLHVRPRLIGLERGARPVLVEGPLDAVAITAGTGGRAVGVASLCSVQQWKWLAKD